jgi:cytochrome c5
MIMKRTKLLIVPALLVCTAVWISCGSEGVKKDEKPVDITTLTKDKETPKAPEIKADEIAFTSPLNKDWVTDGKGIYELKCQACHKLTADKLVGPGWKDVTKRRTPVWIMNMITNTDMMLDSDPEAQKLLELCMVRMPNQNLTKDEARHVIEFMRSNDGEK